MAQFQLKNWYFTIAGDSYPSYWLAHGNAYGNPRFPEGCHIHTSAVRYIEIQPESLLVHTRNSIYRCEFHDCKETDFQFMEEERLFTSGTNPGDLAELKKRILSCRRAQQELEDRRLRSMIPYEEDCVLMVFSNLEDFYFQDFIRWEGAKAIHYTCSVHLGMFQDSVLIDRMADDGGEDSRVDFRYFPYPMNFLEFYVWEEFRGPVYAVNQGERILSVQTPYGTFQLPPDGHPCRIDGSIGPKAASNTGIFSMKLDHEA